MAVVKACPLIVGHSFQNKEEVMLRIAEEANLCNIPVTVQKSCSMQFEVAGPQFFVSASKYGNCWKIRFKCC